jgi:hypothetical protein
MSTADRDLGQRHSDGIVRGLLPPVVRSLLERSGAPLEGAVRRPLEARFGRDLSAVRVHTGEEAARSADALGARAFTVSSDVVFGRGEFEPRSAAGADLLAHEVAHTVQQAGAPPAAELARNTLPLRDSAAEREALAEAPLSARQPAVLLQPKAPPAPTAAPAPTAKDPSAIDETAKKIIDAAKDTSKPIDARAVEAVNAILKAYWDPSLVDKVTYDENEPGLSTSSVGKGADAKGEIVVGKYFVDNIGSFARRVIQVGHELEHIRQYRTGMTGGGKRHERELLANAWSATEPEKAGTGRMSHAMRRDYADEALKHYYCLAEADQKRYAAKKEELLKLREAEDKASNDPKPAPAESCAK